MRTFRKLVIPLLGLAPLFAFATTMLSLNVDGLATAADSVVRGKVVSVVPRWTQDHARIITDTTIEVSETWKGAASKQVVVMQPGGEIGEVGQHVEGIAQFTPGEDVVLFLEARGTERFTVAGMAQGRFRVERLSDGTTQARQDQCGDLYLVDSATKQPVSRPPLAMPIETLKQRVRVLLPAEPTGTGTRVQP
jgi:hypothetical protein